MDICGGALIIMLPGLGLRNYALVLLCEVRVIRSADIVQNAAPDGGRATNGLAPVFECKSVPCWVAVRYS